MTYLAVAFLLAGALQGAPARPPQPPPAQQRQQQPGQPAQPARTATIEGTVLRAVTNEPLGKAQIVLARLAPPQAARGQTAAPQVTQLAPVLTDSDGKFVIKDLAPGSYRLMASRNGYSREEYGQRFFRGAGTTITLQAGQNLKDIVFRLTPAGTISGRVLDASGEPVAGITVQLFRGFYGQNGKQSLSVVLNARTNDLGEYRLYWINPGTYYLGTIPTAAYLQAFGQNLNSPQGGARGQLPAAAVNSTISMMESISGMNPNEVIQPDIAYTYYPSTTNRLKAAPITVQAGSQQQSIDIKLIQEPTYRVRGRILDSRTKQQPLSAVVQLGLKESLGAGGVRGATYDVGTGIFEFQNVGAGEYLLVAFSQSAVIATGISQTTVNVSSNIDNLMLTLVPGSPVKGQVTLEFGKALVTMPELSRARVVLFPASDAIVNVGQPASIQSDGTFTLENVSPGQYRVNIGPLPANAYMKEGRFGEVNLMEQTISVNGPATESIEITLSRNAGQVSGRLLDKDSKPVPATQVVLAPDGHREWRELIKSRPTDQAGKFVFQGVPPGDYKIFAWEDIDPFAFLDPDVLMQYEGQAKAVKVKEMSQENVDVKIIPALQ